MSDGEVRLEIDGVIATVTLDRPEKLNALTPPMLKELAAIVEEIDRVDAVRAVVLTATGERAFCVGADINVWAELEPLGMWRRWVRDGHRVFDAFASLRQPTIAAIEGFAFGGGLELAIAADLRIAGAGASFAVPEVKIGTVPGWGGTGRLPSLIGLARAKQLVFTGEQIDAATAERWGLVNQVVERGTAAARSREIALAIAANAPVAVQLAKQLLDAPAGARSMAVGEAMAGAMAAGTADGAEGVASFWEKRAPRFEGR